MKISFFSASYRIYQWLTRNHRRRRRGTPQVVDNFGAAHSPRHAVVARKLLNLNARGTREPPARDISNLLKKLKLGPRG